MFCARLARVVGTELDEVALKNMWNASSKWDCARHPPQITGIYEASNLYFKVQGPADSKIFNIKNISPLVYIPPIHMLLRNNFKIKQQYKKNKKTITVKKFATGTIKIFRIT